MAGKSAGSRKTTQGKTSSSRTASRKTTKKNGYAQPSEQEEFLRSEVFVIASFAVAVLLFLSNFKLCGFIGDYLRSFQLGIFGTIGFIAPVLLFVGTCFALSNKGNPIAVFKLASVIMGILVMCALMEMFFTGGYQQGRTLADAYARGAAGNAGGGWIGGVIVMALGSMFGTIGAYLVLIVLLAICAVCITEKSLVSFVKKGSGRAYQYAKEDVDRRRVEHQERKEERQRLREERRVRGVNLDSTKLTAREPDPVENRAGGSIPASPEHAVYVDTENLQVGGKSGSGAEKDAAGEITGTPATSETSGTAVSGDAMKNADVFTGSINLPPQYIEEPEGKESQDDTVPFEESEPVEVLRPGKAAKSQETVERWQGTGENAERADGEASMSFLDEDYVETDLDRRFLEEDPEDEIPGTIIPDEDPFEEIDAPGTSTVQGNGAVQKMASCQSGQGDQREPEPSHWKEPVYEIEPRYEPMDDYETEQVYDPEPEYEAEPEYEPERGSVYDPKPEADPVPVAASGYSRDEFTIPEESKRVVTASGKIIETDTEALKKKIERHREEAKESGDLSVSQQIKEKEIEIVKKEYRFPPVDLLKRGSRPVGSFSEQEYKETAIKLQQTLRNFGVGVTVTNISCGPSVTRYELHPEQGVKVSKIVGLADDIKLSLAAADIRIEAPIPGKSAVGIEVPNKENTVVYLRDILESEEFRHHSSKLAFAVGKDIGGQVVVTDVAKMPHLLIAGATGSGKSVCINTLIMSLIYKSDPEDVKMIMVDPKVVELSVYNGIPHLLIPVVTDPKKASAALNWAVAEMMDRYKKFAQYNVRDLKGYNAKVEAIKDIEDDKKPQKMPQIVIIIDELADLMMVSPGEVEDSICRLAQLARAAGIHLVIATQRPSVNVITGLIKANVPSRIAFSVSSGVDSRTIIDMNGAEKLLGKGDMLFYPAGFQKPQRVQGAFVSDQEVAKVVDFLVEQDMTPEYNTDIEKQMAAPSMGAAADQKSDGRDEYFAQAGKFIIEKEKGSIGMLQRMFKIGFNRAARIMDQLAEAGVVGEEEGTKPRKVLMTLEEFEEMLSK